jgi:hypothetical protein
MSVYLAEGGMRPLTPSDLNRVRQIVALQVYFPSAFTYIAPFAILPWAYAHFFWTVFTVASFTLAAYLTWILGERLDPNASFYLISFLLVNCGILYAGGNPAGIAIALCAIASSCFLEGRRVAIGVFCLAVSLALKPHDTGFVWLYFLLVGGVHRKYALQSLAVAIAMGIPAIVWISHVSPHWIEGLVSNLSATSVHGGITDPGPNAMGSSGGGSIIDLQTVISVFKDEPRVYNPITYLICGTLILVWAVVSLRARFSIQRAYLALAAIAALSLLPVYHRTHDAKLLLLTVPACAMLSAEDGILGKIALVMTSTTIVLTSDFPLALLAMVSPNLNSSGTNLSGKILKALIARPMPLILLALGCFYLVIYVKRRGDEATEPSGSNEPAIVAEPPTQFIQPMQFGLVGVQSERLSHNIAMCRWQVKKGSSSLLVNHDRYFA